MSILSQPGKTVVARLRVHGSNLDPLVTRLRVSSLLTMVDLRPAGLPPSAILCIRRLADPLPGALLIDDGGIRPPHKWELAATASLEAAARQASRPSQGPIPANAEAIIFTDHAEMLACLARDWCDGYVSTRWWWQGLFRGMDIASAILPAWVDAPRYVPAALAHLASDGKATLFLRQLGAQDAQALLRAVVHAFALPQLATALDDAPSGRAFSPEPEGQIAPAMNASADLSSNKRLSGQKASPAAPWVRWVPESSTGGLGLEQQTLLGVGLLLQRAPMVVRTQQFAEDVRRWRAEQITIAGYIEQAGVSTNIKPITSTATDINYTTSAGTPAQTRVGPLTWQSTIQSTGDARLDLTGDADQAMAERTASLTDAEWITPHQSASDTFPMLLETAAMPEEPFLSPLRQTCIDTQLGGLFYLINIGLFLGLYGDFTMPARPGILLPVWDFITMLGEHLLGKARPDDPVWPLLAELAGRKVGDAPNPTFEPQSDWRVPAEWLAPFPEHGVWRWSARGGRLRVAHPQGFLVLDVPLGEGRPVEQVRRQVALYKEATHFSLQRGAIPGSMRFARSFDRWVSRLVAYVRASACRALGIAPQEDVARLLFMSRARVCVTASHLDVTFSLDKLPIEVRLAGLDRDPGWVPAAGRFVAFHFE